MTDTTIAAAVREALRAVSYPGARKDVVLAGQVKQITEQDGQVTVELVLPTPAVAPAVRTAFVEQVRAAAAAVAGVRAAQVAPRFQVLGLPAPGDKQRMPGVKNVIAVASGKGGVGKSTVAVNLALALHRWGATVGLLDADVFGPSIPKMLGDPDQPVGGSPDKRILPAEIAGLKVLSIGYFVDAGEAVVWRGPMVHKLLEQFMGDVEWGELDYLVVDLPPGTGDVQISLAQLAQVAGAVMVTTPQEVAVIDVVKGVTMFTKVEVPILGVVENMSGWVCPKCGHAEDIFARGGGRRLAEATGVPFLGEIPIDLRVRAGGDAGRPILLGDPESTPARVFMEMAATIAGDLAARVLSGPRRPAKLVTVR